MEELWRWMSNWESRVEDEKMFAGETYNDRTKWPLSKLLKDLVVQTENSLEVVFLDLDNLDVILVGD
ncbi:hypothetical protein CRG98_008354 [Punica granatum]|uniref:Uncharacterized protein n=1 Tax=Punica granatum TaxID=22663 RepID=A0A2I0KRY7_PUNGR|nr:hypothetical protein CRG98_008354 [Punica granatum]